jgi:hypothetical protein
MKLFLFVAFLAVVASHPTDRVRKLLADLKDTDTDTLREETKQLIQTTETEMKLLENLVESTISQSIPKITANLDIILNSAVNRSTELTSYLTNKVETQSSDYVDEAATTCLTLVDMLSQLPSPFEERIKLTLVTATRIGNETVRNDVDMMDNKFTLLDALSQALENCGDDYECVVDVSEEAVEYNNEFINTFNDMLVNIVQVQQKIVNQAKTDAEATVFANEDYACNTANIMLTCLGTFDKISSVSDGDDTTTETTTETTTQGTTETLPTTIAPDTHCSHESFNPNVNP